MRSSRPFLTLFSVVVSVEVRPGVRPGSRCGASLVSSSTFFRLATPELKDMVTAAIRSRSSLS